MANCNEKKQNGIEHNDPPIDLGEILHNDETSAELSNTAKVKSKSKGDRTYRKGILGEHEVTVQMEDSDSLLDTPTMGNRRIVDDLMERLYSRPMSIFGNTKRDPGPIMGYANEPLLPLAEACAPLVDIIPNLQKYVKAVLNETPEQPPNDLTIDESAAIRLYTVQWRKSNQSLYAMLNYTLNNCDREQLKPYYKYLKLFLTALVKLPCVPSLIIWRGVTDNLSSEFPPDTQVNWWAFSSCTSEPNVLENRAYLGNSGNRTLFSVEAINARKIDLHSQYVEENEVLLLPGTQMIVQSQFSPAENLHIIHLKQVIPKETLLEPPFEGNLNIFNRLFIMTDSLYLGAHLYQKPE